MTSDLSQMFNLRKTATASPPDPAEPAQAREALASPSPSETPQEVGSPPAPRGRRTRTTTAKAAQSTEPAVAEPTPQPTLQPAAEPAPRPASAPPSQEAVASRSGAAAAAPEPAPAGDSRPRSTTSTGGRASIMLYTTQTVRERMRDEAQRTSLSYGQLTLLCIEKSLDRLEQVFAGRSGATSELFSTDYKPRSRGETRSANLNLHIARRDLDIVESLWQRFPGCRSRNDLLSTACALHLTGEADA